MLLVRLLVSPVYPIYCNGYSRHYIFHSLHVSLTCSITGYVEEALIFGSLNSCAILHTIVEVCGSELSASTNNSTVLLFIRGLLLHNMFLRTDWCESAAPTVLMNSSLLD